MRTWEGHSLAALRAEAVQARYSGAMICQGVSAVVEEASLVAVVGPNGAGKSTFAKALAGVLIPVGGRVYLGEEPIAGLPPHQIARKGLSYVPQNQNVFPSLSVIENLEIGGYTRKTGLRQRISEVLDVFPDLAKATKKKAGNLSGGQQSMLAMARALMLQPRAMILDEPTAGLSPAYTEVVWGQIAQVVRLGTAVLVIEQNVDRAIANADYVYVLVGGRNSVEGPSEYMASTDLAAIFLGQAVLAGSDGQATAPEPAP